MNYALGSIYPGPVWLCSQNVLPLATAVGTIYLLNKRRSPTSQRHPRSVSRAVGGWARFPPHSMFWETCAAKRCQIWLPHSASAWSSRLAIFISSIWWRTKGHPGCTTAVACWSEPIREQNSLLVQLLRTVQDSSSIWSLDNFSSGRLSWPRMVSSWRPRKVKVVEGPSSFSNTTGMPRQCKL